MPSDSILGDSSYEAIWRSLAPSLTALDLTGSNRMFLHKHLLEFKHLTKLSSLALALKGMLPAQLM